MGLMPVGTDISVWSVKIALLRDEPFNSFTWTRMLPSRLRTSEGVCGSSWVSAESGAAKSARSTKTIVVRSAGRATAVGSDTRLIAFGCILLPPPRPIILLSAQMARSSLEAVFGFTLKGELVVDVGDY
jgi:hypothetical protein